jgi:transposase
MDSTAIDSHKESVQVHRIDENTNPVLRERYPTTQEGLERLLEGVRGSVCVLEACSTSYPIYDFLTSKGVEVKVAHPLLLKSISGLKKTDKVDAERMALMLKAGIIPLAHIPSQKVRMDRDLVRQHISLVEQRTREKNRVHALLLRYGVKVPKKIVFGKKRNWLNDEIPFEVKPVLEQCLEHIDYLNRLLCQVDKRIGEKAVAIPDCVLLVSVPGVAYFSALLIVSFIDGIERFGSSEQLVSYAGLTPRISQSGEKTILGHISKQGTRELRWVLTQCAWVAVRQKGKFRKFYLKKKRKIGKKKALIAVARKMLTAIYYMLRRKESFNDAC